MSRYVKYVALTILGGIFCRYLPRILKCNQKELLRQIYDESKQVECVNVEDLKKYFDKKTKTQINLFVSGIVSRKNDVLYEQSDKIGVILDRENSLAQQQVSMFQLKPNASISTSSLDVQNFSQTIITPEVLKKKQYSNNNNREREVLLEKMVLCVYGGIIFDQDNQLFFVETPKIFGLSKEKILAYLDEQLNPKIIFSQTSGSGSPPSPPPQSPSSSISFKKLVFWAIVIFIIYKSFFDNNNGQRQNNRQRQNKNQR